MAVSSGSQRELAASSQDLQCLPRALIPSARSEGQDGWAAVEHGCPVSPAVGLGGGFPSKGSSGSSILGRVTSAGLGSLFHRCGPKIPLGLRAISQPLNGLGRGEDERGAGRRSPRSRAMPAGLCPRRRRERAEPVASPSPGAPASRVPGHSSG